MSAIFMITRLDGSIERLFRAPPFIDERDRRMAHAGRHQLTAWR